MTRNALALAAAIAVSLALTAGAGTALWQARTAMASQRRAEEVKEFLVSTLEHTDPYSGAGRALSAVDVLKQAKDKINRAAGGKPRTAGRTP